MKPSPAPCTKCLQAILPAVLLLALPSILSAQEKKPASTSSGSSLNSPPKSTQAPAAKPATPPPPKPAEPTEHHEDHAGASGAHSGGSTGASGANSSNSSGSTSSQTKTATDKTNSGANGKNKPATGKSGPEHTNSIVPADPRAPTGLNLRAESGSTGTYKATGTGTTPQIRPRLLAAGKPERAERRMRATRAMHRERRSSETWERRRCTPTGAGWNGTAAAR